jgi:Mg2+ and Co2+ transporter CorA
MRVRISYAVDADELVDEIAMLVSRATKIANRVADDTNTIDNILLQDELGPEALQRVVEVRDSLIKLDSYLADVAHLILGQQQMLLRDAAQHIDPPPDAGVPTTDKNNINYGGEEFEELLERTEEISEKIAEYQQDDDAL